MAIKDFVFTVTDAPSPSVAALIEDGLSDYNRLKAGHTDSRPLAALVTNPATNEVVGGLLGRTSLGLFFVDLFYLPDGIRGEGIGSRVMQMAEAEARARGCSTAVLYTIVFQAPGFYERHGYRVLGRIECEPPGHTRVCMTKAIGRDAQVRDDE